MLYIQSPCHGRKVHIWAWPHICVPPQTASTFGLVKCNINIIRYMLTAWLSRGNGTSPSSDCVRPLWKQEVVESILLKHGTPCHHLRVQVSFRNVSSQFHILEGRDAVKCERTCASLRIRTMFPSTPAPRMNCLSVGQGHRSEPP